MKLIFTVGEAVRSTCGNQARARAKPERAAGLSMHSCGLPAIFSEVSGPIWFAIVGKSSEGVAEGQVCKIFLID